MAVGTVIGHAVRHDELCDSQYSITIELSQADWLLLNHLHLQVTVEEKK